MRRVLAILAAGSASRAGVDKVAADLGGQPVLAWSLAAGLAAGCFDEIVVIAPPEKVGAVASLARARAPNARVVAGGQTRTASSWIALDAARDADLIAIHAAARPLPPPRPCARCLRRPTAEG